MENLIITRALLSVTHKEGLVSFAQFLHTQKVELVSTGGTLRVLAEAGIPVTPVSDVTGFPEILGGRVKTLHPYVHGGILADKDNAEHLETLRKYTIKPFDLICVNLYDFAKAKADKLDVRQAIEEIDIGGPCMLRAAAKNFHSIAVVPSPSFYDTIIEEMKTHKNAISLGLRQRMAATTFAQTSAYDAMIADFFLSEESAESMPFPKKS